jgi:hypothetical protein
MLLVLQHGGQGAWALNNPLMSGGCRVDGSSTAVAGAPCPFVGQPASITGTPHGSTWRDIMLAGAGQRLGLPVDAHGAGGVHTCPTLVHSPVPQSSTVGLPVAPRLQAQQDTGASDQAQLAGTLSITGASLFVKNLPHGRCAVAMCH